MIEEAKTASIFIVVIIGIVFLGALMFHALMEENVVLNELEQKCKSKCRQGFIQLRYHESTGYYCKCIENGLIVEKMVQ